ncbi:MAG: hypothetical protein A2047_02425 [Omnitrophica bacterium GWA2_41_15]|nr:MAG: hypothetical protein A2047_02425 [Omnitrophica bacterium GWA2_41_15]HAZ10550.1 hypothetical protein [Candidatus Omnitrophota bacterium]
MKSDVYLIKVKTNALEARCDSLQKLLEKVNPFRDYKKDEFIPIKLTIGDSQCVYNIPPELVKIIVSDIKKTKAKPFLFDTNVIYKGERLNAVDHLTLAQSKGFGYAKVGASFIIADGIFGQDGKEYAIDSDYIKKIKIPSFIGSLENLLVLSHATGHILSGYAGAIKNIAMGMVSRPTKQVQHSSLKPHVIDKKCTACGYCVKICPANAISPLTPPSPQRGEGKGEGYVIDQTKCLGCGECLCACKFYAISINWSEDHAIFAKRMVEVAHFILSKFKNKFFITFGLDITKECDCISTKNELIFSENIGILASRDPLSIDKAMIDLINKDKDLFKETGLLDTHKTMFDYGYKKGLGALDYNIIKI